MSQPELLTVAQVQREFKLNHKVIDLIVKKAGLKPIHETPYGVGMMRLYEAASLRSICQAYIDAEKAKIKPAATPPVVPDPGFSLVELQRSITKRDKDVGILLDHVEELTKELKLVKEQNVVIFKKLGDVLAHTSTLAHELGTKAAA